MSSSIAEHSRVTCLWVQTSGPAAADRVGLSLLKSVGALDCHNNWLDNMRSATALFDKVVSQLQMFHLCLHAHECFSGTTSCGVSQRHVLLSLEVM